jgi:hypothetical protein
MGSWIFRAARIIQDDGDEDFMDAEELAILKAVATLFKSLGAKFDRLMPERAGEFLKMLDVPGTGLPLGLLKLAHDEAWRRDAAQNGAPPVDTGRAEREAVWLQKMLERHPAYDHAAERMENSR